MSAKRPVLKNIYIAVAFIKAPNQENSNVQKRRMDKQTEGHVTLRDHANQDNETISNKHALLTTRVF